MSEFVIITPAGLSVFDGTLREAIQFANDNYTGNARVTVFDVEAGRAEYMTGVNLPVNMHGNYYASDGTFMNHDGTRSIFDDVDL